jgi:hypothetical protein
MATDSERDKLCAAPVTRIAKVEKGPPKFSPVKVRGITGDLRPHE